jgi:hypothetical protein
MEKVDDKAFEELCRLMKEKHAREASKPKPQFKLPSFLQWFALETREYNRQQKCSHLKGGSIRRSVPNTHRDYHVGMHTFPNGETKIWCFACGWNVWNRPGWSFKWAYGMKMVENSTNWPSSSQIAPEILKGKTPTNVRIDVAGGARVIYFDKDPV